ncbi:MAG: Holliday junction branch migration protein RuvA, partial [Microbacteriaceae bacterium]|nr:Holliday junction branch migration protein RuvA [Microbacteriaceae bacterium]
MISSLRGVVLRATGAELVIEVGGVGYLVNVTPEHALTLRVGDEAFVHTYLIVREDALTLYGFLDAEQLEVFELLLGVNGVGPKSALGVLAVLTPDQVAAAVQADDDAAFRKVSGIGPKTAKLITVQLAGKLHAVAPTAAAKPKATAARTVADDVRIALIGLGWPEKTAAGAVD